MNKKRLFTLVPLTLASLLLAACGPSAEANSDAVLTQAAQIFADSLTQTAAVAPPTATATIPPTATNTPLPPTNTPTITGTPPTSTPKPTQQASGGSSAGCLRAELTWETPTDGTKFEVGATFTKTWVFKNIGTCTWNSFFSVVFIEGEQMDADTVESFEEVSDVTDVGILPGEHVTIKVSMSAPNEQGTYKGYWMLRSDGGTLFGLGPKGTEWFWVEIYAED